MGNAADLIFNFQTISPIEITRYATPQTVDAEGVFVDGSTVDPPISVIISVQPYTDKEVLLLPEGDRTRRWMKGYCSDELVVTNEKTGVKGDRIPYDGVIFEVMGCQRWVGDFNYWKIKMAEVNPE